MNQKTLIWIVAGLAVVALAAGGCVLLFFSGLFFQGETPAGPEPTPTMTQLPQPVINFPVEGMVGQPVTFDGNESQPGANPIDSYTWDFGDGNSGDGAVVEHIYEASGTYDVTMTVTDTAGFGNVGGPVQITINEAPPGPTPTMTQLPQPVINYPPETRVGDQVTFDGSQSQPGSFPIASYDWDFGDSSTARGPVVTHEYRGIGVYQVRLTVTDDKGFGNIATVQIKVNEAAPVPGAPPQAVINYPTEVRVGEQATFDGGQSIAGGSPITGYDWDFGDGERAGGSRVTHIYDDPGSYEVNLRVTADDGQQNRANVKIKVIELEVPEPPTPTAEEPTPTMPPLPEPKINYPAEGAVGQPVTFDGSESRPGGNPIDSYTWDFGDGNSGEGAVAEHIYNAPGVYNVTLTVTDTAGFGNVGGPVQITINEAN